MQNVQIECADALYIIGSRDSADSFFYCDPPYYNSDMGHYDGYNEQDFENLLKLLSGIKGKFLLSAYPSSLLQRYIEVNGWQFKSYDSAVSVNKNSDKKKRKCEMLVWSYRL